MLGGAIRIRWQRARLAVPFAILFGLGIARLVWGPGQGLLPLLALGPAVAAALGGVRYTAVVGAVALGEGVLFAVRLEPITTGQQIRNALIVIAAVTVGGALASYVRLRRERELMKVREVADVAQRVVMRPLPRQVGPVHLTARYLSASTQAEVGGDLYAAVPTARGLRLIVGDAEGKGLSAVREAATAMGAFRVAGHKEGTLSVLADEIEAALARELGEEQFITAVLAEVSQDNGEMVILNCGHPQPLRLGSHGPELLGPADGGLPLGLGRLAPARRVPYTVPWEAGEPILFYTDGLTEARDRAGTFFPLTDCGPVRAPGDPHTFIERLSAEVGRHVGHQPHDDIALLLVWRQDGDPLTRVGKPAGGGGR